MLAITVLMVGAIMVYIGGTDMVMEFSDYAGDVPNTPGYKDIPFFVWALASMIIALPLVNADNNQSWAWKYVGLILALALLTNVDSFKLFVGDLEKFYSGSLFNLPES